MLGFTLFNLVQAPKNGPFVYRTMIEDALVSCSVILLHYFIALFNFICTIYEKNALPQEINSHTTQQLHEYTLFLKEPIVLMFHYHLHSYQLEFYIRHQL